MTTPAPDFTTPEFLHEHVHSILAFYESNVVSATGGFHQCFMDNGEVYDSNTRHLVSSTRFVFNYAMAYRHYNQAHYKSWATQGLNHLLDQHRQPIGHFAWVLDGSAVSDARAMAYGQAFVMLAASACIPCEIDGAEKCLYDTFDFLEKHFWDKHYELYADERDGSLTRLDPYRGQNANMHLCEALLAAFEATQNNLFLDRAETLARRVAIELADSSGGLIWEHYDKLWRVDMEYNIDKPDDLFKPWGFQPGHQVEWCKLLLQLYAHRPDPQWIERAISLYQQAMSKGWDHEFGGLVYGFSPDGSFCDSHKYFWVHAEAFAAAWRLYRHTNDSQYLEDYKKIWSWSWEHLIDHQYGAWFRIRNRDGSEFDKLKSPPGKTDYHTMGACWDVLANQ